LAKKVHRGYESEWGKDQNGHLPGQSITIKEPMQATVVDGLTVSIEDLKERSTTMSLNSGKNIAHKLTSLELTYGINDLTERVIIPACRALANQVDQDIAAVYSGVPNQIGTPGTTPSAFFTFAQAAQYLTEMGVPEEDRCLVLNPAAHAKVADNLKGLFIQDRVDDMVKKGYIAADLAGFEVYKSNNLSSHTCGTACGSSAVLVDDTVADGDTGMNLDQNGAGSALTFKHGDVFSCATPKAINPLNRTSLGRARNFCIDADAVFADAGGGDYNVDVTCTPGTSPHQMYETGSYMNMNALPANNDALTIPGSSGLIYPVNLAFQKNAIALVMKPLAKLDSAVWYATQSYKGYTISVMKYIEGSTRSEVIRFDILFGVSLLQPDGVVRIAG